jgi:hypothetical protein
MFCRFSQDRIDIANDRKTKKNEKEGWRGKG